MSLSAIWGCVQKQPDSVEIPAKITLDLNKKGFMFAFREFPSLGSGCGVGCATRCADGNLVREYHQGQQDKTPAQTGRI